MFSFDAVILGNVALSIIVGISGPLVWLDKAFRGIICAERGKKNFE